MSNQIPNCVSNVDAIKLGGKSNVQNMQIAFLDDLTDVEKAYLDALREMQKKLKAGGGGGDE
ncbi:MAG: hypothetical protein FWC36_10890 [Spirochaetes bacterium]|nr:hypothetical protein [Spirochaetota bacterium]